MLRISASEPIRGIAAALAITILTLGGAAPANAAEDPQDCIFYEDDDVLVCVPSGDDLLAAFTEQTGYTTVPSPDDGEPLASRGPLVVYILATLWQNNGYTGTSFTFSRSTPCNGVTLSSIADLGVVGLNDSVSSFQTFGTCTVRLYEDLSYGGATYGYTTSQSSLPTFNDIAGSARAR